jgi:hypothetical protein
MISQSLLNNVARHLSGRPAVAVRLQEPVWNGSSGACYKTERDGAIIDINPGASDFLYVFLHEVAHLRYDFSQMTQSDYWKSEAGSIKIEAGYRKELNSLPRESKADRQAEIWKRYAVENAWKYHSGDNLLEKELLALLDAVDPYAKSNNQPTWKPLHRGLK